MSAIRIAGTIHKDCYGLTIGSIDQYQNQAELNVGSQQTFVHSLTGFQNGTLNIDAGGNVTVNQGSLLAPSKVLVSSPLRKTAAMCWQEGAVDGANRRYSR